MGRRRSGSWGLRVCGFALLLYLPILLTVGYTPSAGSEAFPLSSEKGQSSFLSGQGTGRILEWAKRIFDRNNSDSRQFPERAGVPDTNRVGGPITAEEGADLFATFVQQQGEGFLEKFLTIPLNRFEKLEEKNPSSESPDENLEFDREQLATPIEEELQSLRERFEEVFSSLFQESVTGIGSTSSNPFQEALQVGSESLPLLGGSTASPDSSILDRISAQRPGPREGGEDRAGEQVYSFLLAGVATGNPRVLSPLPAVRDYTNGGFLLSNHQRIPIFFGAHTSVLVFEEQESVLTGDLTRNGMMDFAVFRPGPLGTLVVLFVQRNPGRWELEASGFLPGAYIHSFTFLDVTGDGEPELIAAAEGRASLMVLRRIGTELVLAHEWALPFELALMFDSRPSFFFPEKQLFLLDKNLRESAVITVADGNPLMVRAPLAVERLARHSLDLRGSGVANDDIFVLEDGKRVILAENVSSGFRQIAGFDRDIRISLVILGDFFEQQSRQLILIP